MQTNDSFFPELNDDERCMTRFLVSDAWLKSVDAVRTRRKDGSTCPGFEKQQRGLVKDADTIAHDLSDSMTVPYLTLIERNMDDIDILMDLL